jgi:hypothetical protein
VLLLPVPPPLVLDDAARSVKCAQVGSSGKAPEPYVWPERHQRYVAV